MSKRDTPKLYGGGNTIKRRKRANDITVGQVDEEEEKQGAASAIKDATEEKKEILKVEYIGDET